jgi:hypothetical protein
MIIDHTALTHSVRFRESPSQDLCSFMSFHMFSRLLVIILLPFAFLCTTYLYLYPLFHGCAFPVINGSRTAAVRNAFALHWPHLSIADKAQQAQIAPFRLLVLADPQLEGDSSLPDSEDGFLRRLDQHREHVFSPHRRKALRKRAIKTALKELIFGDIPDVLQALRKRLDLFGNDYYLAHIFRTLHWWTKPTHVTVLGDLIGSQWVTDEEFEARAGRYWRRVFAGGNRVEDDKTVGFVEEALPTGLPGNKEMSGTNWENRVINVAGNHDIGYAGDVSKARIARFEKHFGRADWDIRFTLPVSDPQHNATAVPSVHLVVLNDLVLDTPARDSDVQSASYDYMNSIITKGSHPVEDKSSFTLVLTHVPLYKPEGVCVDPPFFDFHNSDDKEGDYKPGGLKEQNHLSDHVSRSGILEGIYGMTANRNAAGNGKGRKGVILTGHDHEGCDVWHYLPESSTENAVGKDSEELKFESWNSMPWRDANMSASYTGVREVTFRSMMGQFGGNAGLLSLWFDFDKHEWQHEVQMCELGVQHIWWGIHVLDLVTTCMTLVWLLSSYLAAPSTAASGRDKEVVSTPKENAKVPDEKEPT